MKLLKGNEIDTLKWQQLVDESPNASFFQTKACYDFYRSLSFLEPFLIGVEEGEHLQALACGYLIASKNFPASYFSCRAIILGGVLIRSNCAPEAINLLLSQLKSQLQKKAIYIEIRNFNDYGAWKSNFEQLGFCYHTHYNVQNNLVAENEESIFRHFGEEKQRQIKKSQTHGIICEVAQNVEELAVFYNLLSEFYRKEIRLPLFPFNFFVNLQRQKNSDILLVKNNTEIIGGIVLVHDQNTSYEWFVCGDKNSNYSPSVVVTAAGILHAQKIGMKKFDFMGAGNDTEKVGIRNFKLRFGGELLEQGRFLYICKPLLYKAGKKAIQIITKK